MSGSIASNPSSLVIQQGEEPRKKHPPISRLPDEILSEVFVQHVYRPCEGYVIEWMSRRMSSIYCRVYTLIRVCVAWRRVGLACPGLWKVVPIINQWDYDSPRVPSNEIVLQRAGNKNLHLAISLDRLSYERFEDLLGHWHRFSVINVWSDSLSCDEIAGLLGNILEHSSPGSISRLSIKYKFWGKYSNWHVPMPLGTHIIQFVGSLSAFRIGCVKIDWEHITFSHRLVELQVDHIMLESESEIRALFAALSSAHELKKLKLIYIQPNPDLLRKIKPLEVISLPKLEFLYPERCELETLDLILSHITRGSCHLTLNMRPAPEYNYDPEGDAFADCLYAFLKRAPVDKLILWGNSHLPWKFANGLQRAFESIPGLKTLVLNDFIVNLDLLMALKQPPTPKLAMDTDTSPKLTRLEIHGASLTASLLDLKPGFEAVFKSHQIQNMVLGGSCRSALGMKGTPIDENDEVVGWMRRNVPHFSISCEAGRVPDEADIWELWDI